MNRLRLGLLQIFIAMLFALAGCSDKPSVDLGRTTFESYLKKQLGDTPYLINSFDKTNGQSEETGIPTYRMYYSALVTLPEGNRPDCVQRGNAFNGFACMRQDFLSFPAEERGARLRFTGTMQFQKSENGWLAGELVQPQMSVDTSSSSGARSTQSSDSSTAIGQPSYASANILQDTQDEPSIFWDKVLGVFRSPANLGIVDAVDAVTISFSKFDAATGTAIWSLTAYPNDGSGQLTRSWTSDFKTLDNRLGALTGYISRSRQGICKVSISLKGETIISDDFQCSTKPVATFIVQKRPGARWAAIGYRRKGDESSNNPGEEGTYAVDCSLLSAVKLSDKGGLDQMTDRGGRVLVIDGLKLIIADLAPAKTYVLPTNEETILKPVLFKMNGTGLVKRKFNGGTVKIWSPQCAKTCQSVTLGVRDNRLTWVSGN